LIQQNRKLDFGTPALLARKITAAKKEAAKAPVAELRSLRGRRGRGGNSFSLHLFFPAPPERSGLVFCSAKGGAIIRDFVPAFTI